jgi:hypothetical protein
MKKTILLLLILQAAFFCLAQTNSFQVVSSKVYENNTQTAYLNLNSKIDESMKEMITEEILSNPLISNFSFYNKSDMSKCMFTFDMSIDTETIVQMIYDIIEETSDVANGRFVENWTNSNEKGYYFIIDGITNDLQKNQIVEFLMKDQQITFAVINDSDCKIMTLQDITPEYVQTLLDNFDVTINPISIE